MAEKQEKKTHMGVFNIERRRHPRFSIDYANRVPTHPLRHQPYRQGPQCQRGWDVGLSSTTDRNWPASKNKRSEERSLGKDFRSRWSPYH